MTLLQIRCASLPYKWLVTAMEHLELPEWVPLSLLAPCRSQQSASPELCEPLSLHDWDMAASLARDALKRAHQIRYPNSPDGQPTVHGDVRLPNILAHRAQGGGVDQIKFVDFDWAGVEGKSR